MIKNVIWYKSFEGKERMLPFDKEINSVVLGKLRFDAATYGISFYDTQRILHIYNEIERTSVDFSQIVEFSRINQENKNENGVSTIERYVIGVPYKYADIDMYVGNRLRKEVMLNGKRVSERTANCYFDVLTGNVIRKDANTHIVSTQKKLLKILMDFIEENNQTIVELSQEEAVSRTRTRRYIIKR